jgi:DNA-binding NtrC family response regulator
VTEPNSICTSAAKTIILAVISQDDARILNRLLAGSTWELLTVETVAAARAWLQRNSVPIVLCERRLPDGDWKDLLQIVYEMDRPAQVVLISREADNALWAEALNLGAFDVLPLPARSGEISGSISSAWRNWNQQSGSGNNHTSAGLHVRRQKIADPRAEPNHPIEERFE